MMKVYTIKDIAKMANVGISTVSRVLNNRPDVNPETRDRVMKVVEDSGYIPNANAKHLKQTTTEIICLMVKGYSNLFFVSIIETIQREIESNGYIPLVHYIDELDNEMEVAKQIYIEKKVRGIIFLGANVHGNEAALKGFKIPCVLSTSTAATGSLPNVSSVCVDDRAAAKMAVEKLFDAGHREIAVIGGARDSINSISFRFQGVLDSFKARNLQFKPENYIQSKFSLETTYQKMMAFLNENRPEPITAIFAMSDIMALGASKAITDFGLKIPEDISIIGFDGIEMAHFYNPSICTVQQPAAEIAKASVDLIIKHIDNLTGATHLILPVSYVEGKSVAQR